MADGSPHDAPTPAPEFDAYAADYHAQHSASIRASGEDPEHFARYKAQDAARWSARAGLRPSRILDFGTGIGNALPHLADAFPCAEITGLDPSDASLALARAQHGDIASLVPYDGRTVPFADDAFDLVFTACVFHHVPEDEHVALLAELRRVLRPGGAFFLFEHNPLNPLTRRAVRLCPFDADAVLIGAPEMARRMRLAGFRTRVRYRVFVSGPLRALRGAEAMLHWCPGRAVPCPCRLTRAAPPRRAPAA